MLCHNRELFTARVDALSKVVDTGGDTDTHISVEMTMTCFLSSSNVLSSSQKNQWTKVDDDKIGGVSSLYTGNQSETYFVFECLR